MRRGWMIALLAVLGIAVSSCDWPEYGYNPAHTNATSIENSIDANNVSTLVQKWALPAGPVSYSAPADASGTIYYDTAANADSLSYLDALSGTTGALLWQASLAFGNGDSPAVANGIVYSSGYEPTDDGSADSVLFAFDAAGITNCSGTPKVCSPLWQFNVGGLASPVNVDNGVVYVAANSDGDSQGGLYALNATTGALLWSVSGGGFLTSPTVSNGVLYEVTDAESVNAYDLNGNFLWSDAGGAATPAVSHGILYTTTDGKLAAFDTNGVTNCSGSPKTCLPLWTASVGNTVLGSSSPAIANGVVYIGGYTTASTNSTLFAFDANGVTSCSGTPKVCGPLWTAATGNSNPVNDAVAVANGLVYFGSDEVYAYDASGVTNCTGTPKTCAPLWSTEATTASNPSTHPVSLVVAYGNVYVGSTGNYGTTLFDFAAP